MRKMGEGFDALARSRTPDLWPEIDGREPRTDADAPSGARRAVAMVVAIAIAIAGFGVAAAIFDRASTEPADTTMPLAPPSALIAMPVSSEQRATPVTRGLDIAVMRPDGSAFLRVTGQPADLGPDPWVARYGYSSDDSPAFSPDGGTIAFIRRYGEGIDAICTVGVDGSGFRVLTRSPGGGGGGELTWSPDGSLFAYYAAGQVHVANADGTGDHTIAPRIGGTPNQDTPSWLPDSRHVVYTAGDVFLAAADGSDVRLVVDPPRFVTGAAVSPDGSAVAIIMQGRDELAADVWLVNIDGSNLRRLSSDVTPWSVTWAPDGRSILITSEGESLVMELAGPTRRLPLPGGVAVAGAAAWWGAPTV